MKVGYVVEMGMNVMVRNWDNPGQNWSLLWFDDGFCLSNRFCACGITLLLAGTPPSSNTMMKLFNCIGSMCLVCPLLPPRRDIDLIMKTYQPLGSIYAFFRGKLILWIAEARNV